MNERLFAVVPAYNEAPVVARVIRGIRDAVPGISILVVNDGSQDDTEFQARAAGASVVNMPFNSGYGLALHTGLLSAFRSGADIVVTLDADGQHEPALIPRLMQPVIDGTADLTLGSRYLPESQSYRVPIIRRLPSKCLAVLVSSLSGRRFTDTTTGFQCMNRQVLGRFVALKDFPEHTPDADLILYAVRTGARVREIPVTMYEDDAGGSMHGFVKSLFYLPNMLTAILRVLLDVNRVSKE